MDNETYGKAMTILEAIKAQVLAAETAIKARKVCQEK